MGFSRGKNIIEDGLILLLDAGSTRSYPGSGNVWRNLARKTSDLNLNSNVFNNNGIASFFDGSFSTSSGGEISYSSRSALTVDIWLRTPNDFTSATQRAIMYPVGTNSSGGWGLLTSRAQTHSFNLLLMPIGGDMGGGSTSWYFGYRDTSIGNNQWVNFSFSYLGSRTGGTLNENMVEAFINGQKNPNRYAIHSAVMTSAIGGNGSLVSLGTSSFVDVGQKIAIIRIYNRALSESELLRNYNLTRSRFGI